MATKTISVNLEAYERLRAARIEPTESFSKVINREIVPKKKTLGDLLSALEAGDVPSATEETLAYWDAAENDKAPPRDKWAEQ